MQQSNKVTLQTKLEVQEFNGGWAIYAATYEQVEHVRTGIVEKPQIIRNQKISRVFGDERIAHRELNTFANSEPFTSFRKVQ